MGLGISPRSLLNALLGSDLTPTGSLLQSTGNCVISNPVATLIVNPFVPCLCQTVTLYWSGPDPLLVLRFCCLATDQIGSLCQSRQVVQFAKALLYSGAHRLEGLCRVIAFLVVFVIDPAPLAILQ